ncbi:fungal-specific transcription factor domain-containing protein [Xylaria scruposa]|nr:fungal-specific transcription factor domain-containing protein [Xylaria scruposa]
MTTDITSSVKRPTARRKDPACGTCRKKCRKCDRKRPICDRCRTKGLHCEGYPPRFQFCEMITAPRRQSSVVLRRNSIAVSTCSLPRSIISGESPSGSLAEPEALVTTSKTNSASLQASRSPGRARPESNILSIPSSPLPAHSELSAQPSPVHVDSDSSLLGPTDQHEEITNQQLIDHFDRILSEHLTIHVQGIANPFREHVLPLAYRHQGILHALLGLSACHLHLSGRHESQRLVTISLRYRVSALHSLGSLLSKEEVSGLTISEEEHVLGMVLLSVLHDVCETGVSSHGAHLTGVSFLCKRLACPIGSATRSKASIFFISALAWLDMLRGFSGAEKLAYSDDVRKCVRDHGSLSLHTLVGCPPIVFYRIGQVLEAGKSALAGELSLENFRMQLDEAEKFFRSWDPDQAVYPTSHREWRCLAEAYRHACLLRILRFPDAFVISCEDTRVKESASAILDVCADMPRDHRFYKRLLFPLFLAGVDTSSPHQLHYASWCIGEIKHSTGFQHPAMTELLTKVWKERRANAHSSSNVPWMEFTCSELLRSQHAYLFF